MRRSHFATVAVFASLAIACSTIFEDPVQCNSDADCARFSNARCDRDQHVCVSRSASAADATAPLSDGAADAANDAATSFDASDAQVADTYRAESAPVVTYLSDLVPTAMTNGYGPYEKDTSNGENAAGDGVTITLNGTTFAKGLGVHAASELSYALNGAYSTFLADVGVDDEVMANGSVVFQVLVDDVVMFDSGTMTGDTVTKQVSVNVAGKQVLKLVVTDAGDGESSDHADWAGARLVQ